MEKRKTKKKIIFLGDTNSINIELVIKSFKFLKNKVNYIIVCNKNELTKNKFFKKSKLKINEILDPINFINYKKENLNIFNVENINRKKYLNLLNQIKISNEIANFTKYDLITMPINKDVFKKKISFIGMTEYLGFLNKKQTSMLMYGDSFSIIPITTHINLKTINKFINFKFLNSYLENVLYNLKKKIYALNYKEIIFLCYNPHCGESGTLGAEDILIKKIIKNFKKIKGPYPADSAFDINKKNRLYISTYHDQSLIPFKILNKKSLNLTLGLNYRRLSPAHGTAKDIKNKYVADNTSYLTCQLF